MRYNDLGNTRLRLSALSFGAGTAAGLMVNGAAKEQLAAVRTALDCGINHFDTSPFYGYGASEVYLGQALREAGAHDALITSKVPIGREFLQTRELRRCVRQSVEQSLSRLRRDTIDILLVHNTVQRAHQHYDGASVSDDIARLRNDYIPILTFDDVIGEGGVREEVERLKKEGKIRGFGLSGQDHDPVTLKAIIGSGQIDIFNQTYNLMNPTAGYPAARGGRKINGSFAAIQQQLFLEFDDVIENARTAGVGVSIISPLAAGALTDSAQRGERVPAVSERGARFPLTGQYESQVALARRFKHVADEAGISLTELGVRFILSTPGVTTIVTGPSDAAQVEDVARSIDKPPLTDDILARLREIWFDDYAQKETSDGPARARKSLAGATN